jgi:hypothetical protein
MLREDTEAQDPRDRDIVADAPRCGSRTHVGVWGARPTLRGGALDKAIGADRDAPMAALEAMTYLAAAMAITSLT